jgi:hypothetical protein
MARRGPKRRLDVESEYWRLVLSGVGTVDACRVALMHYRPLAESSNVELRVHDTTLYNSLFVGDDHMIVNAHVFGMNAYGAPVYHLRRMREEGLFDTYATSFEAVWKQSRLPSEEA